ncbi:hypothetical protein MMC28_007279 [Mycoblastus sanguinarius]|nr:hypothetical protein [Mycoblastus sanguinarius]
MQGLYLLLLSLSSRKITVTPSTVVINPTTSSSPNDISNSINSTLANVANVLQVGSPDPRFSIKVSYDEPGLNHISVLMNAVQVMADLALRGFYGQQESFSGKLARYPNVGISILPNSIHSGRSIERRFVVWGLRMGIMEVIDSNRFQAVAFTIYMEEIEVGVIKIFQPLPRNQYANPANITNTTWISLESQDVAVSETTTSSFTEISLPTNITDIANDQQLTVVVQFAGQTIPILDIFRAVFSALADAAVYSSTQLVTNSTHQKFQASQEYPSKATRLHGLVHHS